MSNAEKESKYKTLTGYII